MKEKACTNFECRDCGNFSGEGFGGMHGTLQCPECGSQNVSIEFDE